MKKEFKYRYDTHHIYIQSWVTEGLLFGPSWMTLASFDNIPENMERCKKIVKMLNECRKTSIQLIDE